MYVYSIFVPTTKQYIILNHSDDLKNTFINSEFNVDYFKIFTVDDESILKDNQIIDTIPTDGKLTADNLKVVDNFHDLLSNAEYYFIQNLIFLIDRNIKLISIIDIITLEKIYNKIIETYNLDKSSINYIDIYFNTDLQNEPLKEKFDIYFTLFEYINKNYISKFLELYEKIIEWRMSSTDGLFDFLDYLDNNISIFNTDDYFLIKEKIYKGELTIDDINPNLKEEYNQLKSSSSDNTTS